MRRRVCLLVLIVGFAATSHAQNSTPDLTYTLHAQPFPKSHAGWTYSIQAPEPRSVPTPDGVLLVLLPQADGQWVLKQITAWDTPSPSEKTLTFAVGLPDRDKTVSADDLRISNDGSYVIVRIRINHIKLDITDPGKFGAVVVIVDLRTFTVLSRQETTNTLLATAIWHFTKGGFILAQSSSPTKYHAADFRLPSITQFQAATLSLPGLESSQPCTFTVTYAPYSGSPGEREHAISDIGGYCPALLAAAGFASVEQLIFPVPVKTGIDTSTKIAPPPTCHDGALSEDKKFAWYSCFIEHNGGSVDGMFSYATSLSLRVLSASDGRTVLSIPWRYYEGLSITHFASIRGQDFLLILLAGTKLEVFRLP